FKPAEIRGKNNLPDFLLRGQARKCAIHPFLGGRAQRFAGRCVFRVHGGGKYSEKREKKKQSAPGGHCLKKIAARRRSELTLASPAGYNTGGYAAQLQGALRVPARCRSARCTRQRALLGRRRCRDAQPRHSGRLRKPRA